MAESQPDRTELNTRPAEERFDQIVCASDGSEFAERGGQSFYRESPTVEFEHVTFMENALTLMPDGKGGFRLGERLDPRSDLQTLDEVVEAPPEPEQGWGDDVEVVEGRPVRPIRYTGNRVLATTVVLLKRPARRRCSPRPRGRRSRRGRGSGASRDGPSSEAGGDGDADPSPGNPLEPEAPASRVRIPPRCACAEPVAVGRR